MFFVIETQMTMGIIYFINKLVFFSIKKEIYQMYLKFARFNEELAYKIFELM
jgi:hypothetical protein